MKVRTLARMQGTGSWTLAATAAAALACASPHAARAQEATRIVAATVYPDSAGVERELKVPGGTRHITIACVPAAVDVSTLQVDGDPDARLGDVRATDLPESRVEECAPPVSTARRKAIEQQRATLESQRDANDLAFTFLKQWGAGAHADAPEPATAPSRGAAPAGVARPGATATELRHTAFDLLSDQARIKRDLAALALEETRLGEEQPAAKGKGGWRTLRFDVWSPAAATLRVRYNVAGTYWRPTYRASLDVARNTLRIDRQAEIVQASGEDWSDVRVKLSTRQSLRRAEAEVPTPWWLDLLQAVAQATGFNSAQSAPASPMMVSDKAMRPSRLRSPDAEPPPCGCATTSREPTGGRRIARRWTWPATRCASIARPRSCRPAARTGATCA